MHQQGFALDGRPFGRVISICLCICFITFNESISQFSAKFLSNEERYSFCDELILPAYGCNCPNFIHQFPRKRYGHFFFRYHIFA